MNENEHEAYSKASHILSNMDKLKHDLYTSIVLLTENIDFSEVSKANLLKSLLEEYGNIADKEEKRSLYNKIFYDTCLDACPIYHFPKSMGEYNLKNCPIRPYVNLLIGKCYLEKDLEDVVVTEDSETEEEEKEEEEEGVE